MNLWWVGTHPEYGHKGIATKLFLEIEKIAKTNNCELIFFTSEDHRTGAHAFYQKMGYKIDSKGFHKDIE